jgi:CAAX protease family protein
VSFFLLVFALSVPFWIVGGATGADLGPGVPLAALMAICPGLAALILSYRREGRAGVLRLVRRSLDYRRMEGKLGSLSILAVMPLVMLASYEIMKLTGLPLPVRPEFSLLAAPVLFAGFLVAALAEELGWSGYALDPMQARWGPLRAGLLLGLVWAFWHLVPLVEAHRSAGWIASWSLGTLANRVILVWLFNHSGESVFAAAVYHATINMTWQLFPNHGSHYDPRVAGALLALVALVLQVG